MFSPEEQQKIQAQAVRQWQQEQRRVVHTLGSYFRPGWVIETAAWPFPLTSDDLAFLKINRISTT